MFSVVIPVYRLTYLEEAVRSLLDQEPQHLLAEAVLVTDGLGADDLPLPAATLADRRIRIMPITAGTPTAAATKWNAGLEAATAPWVIMFADDDVLGPAALAALAAAHDREPDAGVLRLRQWQIDAAGKVIQIGPKHPDHEDWWDHWHSRFFYGEPSCLQEYAVRTDVARAVGGVPDRELGWWTDDVYVIKAAAMGAGIAGASHAIVNWRFDGHNVSAGAMDAARAAEARASIGDLEAVLAAHGHEVPFDLQFLRSALQARLERTGADLHDDQPSVRTLLGRSAERARAVFSRR